MTENFDRKLILVELNEINFDLVGDYIQAQPARFPAFRRLLASARIRSTAEHDYDKLEPWIQWPSVHSGMSYEEHRIFRLGDVVGSGVPQVFERLERAGYSVGILLAMNAENRLAKPAYFLPDPWTKTQPDNSWWSKVLSHAVAQGVNDNAQGRITLQSAFYLALGLLRFGNPRHLGLYARLAARSAASPWCKALLLDLFVHDLHFALFGCHRPNFSTVFLNAGAHIQHHYFFNAAPVKATSPHRNPGWYANPEADPVADMLDVYDRIVADYLDLREVEVIVATGLSQRPYDRVKYYYRLRDHGAFLRKLGLDFSAVHPRMTRDFLVEFDSAEAALRAQQLLASIKAGEQGEPLFEEIDNRGTSIFVTLTYPHEIHPDLKYEVAGESRSLHPHVAFVAIKNGMHQKDGFAFFTPGVASCAPAEGSHVKELYASILSYFGLPARPTESLQVGSTT